MSGSTLGLTLRHCIVSGADTESGKTNPVTAAQSFTNRVAFRSGRVTRVATLS